MVMRIHELGEERLYTHEFTTQLKHGRDHWSFPNLPGGYSDYEYHFLARWVEYSFSMVHHPTNHMDNASVT